VRLHLPCQSPPSRIYCSTIAQLLTSTRAILNLKIQRDRLQKYQKRIAILTAREKDIAKELLAKGDKQRALLALRRKKYQESLLLKTDAQLAQLESLTHDVEFALVQKSVVFGLQEGTRVLKEIQKEMGGIEHVEKLMEDTAEAVQYQNEVSEMLGGLMTNAEEDEVEDELEAMEREMGVKEPETKLPTAPDGEILPDAPTGELTPKERAKAREEKRAREQEEAEKGQAMLA
jgi:charged multivesicular body protein 6